MRQFLRRGFTLIELMIVVAIIAIIAAIAIPSLIRSRIAANETAAIQACKAFAEAEEIYCRTDYTGSGALHYSLNLGGVNSLLGTNEELSLVDKTIAAAEGQPGAITADKAGYVFTVLTTQGVSATGGARCYIDKVGLLTLGYGLSAVPAAYDSTGVNTYIISNGGTIFQCDRLNAGSATHVATFNPDTLWIPSQ